MRKNKLICCPVNIQAIWSPHVTLLERRVNVYRMNDKRVTPFERAVTYEGPSHFSNEVFCAPHLEKEIKKVCNAIVQHFASVEHKQITRMVLYFKLCQEGKLWFLWSSSIRVGVSQEAPLTAPLNLSPRFSKPPSQTQDLSTLELDHDLEKLEKSDMFSQELTSRVKDPKLHKTTSSIESATPEKNNLSIIIPQSKNQSVISSPTDEQKELERISECLDDLFYEAYSHFLQGISLEYPLMFPTHLLSVLQPKQEELEDVLKKYEIVKCDNAAADDSNATADYMIQKKNFNVSKMQHQLLELKQVLLQMYASK